MIVRNFNAINVRHKGYVTLPEIRAWRGQMRATWEGQSNTTV